MTMQASVSWKSKPHVEVERSLCSGVQILGIVAVPACPMKTSLGAAEVRFMILSVPCQIHNSLHELVGEWPVALSLEDHQDVIQES
jgi:hypothetical protein